MKQYLAITKGTFVTRARHVAEDWDLLQANYDEVMSSIRDVDLKSYKDFDKDPDRNWNPFKKTEDEIINEA